ncbi:MAG: acetate/propionate family kinase [Roseiarcus sp.]
MSAAILVLNAGSSSVKFAIYRADPLEMLVGGEIDAIGDGAHFRAWGAKASDFAGAGLPADGDHETLLAWLLDAIRAAPDLPIVGAGHRVVHGGPHFDKPVVLDEKVIEALDRLTPLARAHQPHNLAAIRTVAKRWPQLPQVACFDTSFHRTQPRLAELFAIPRRFADEGLLRYGFHGLSYDYMASVLPQVAGAKADGRVIVAHLGSGASLCAMRGRKSLATTMGLTAIDGLMMGSRCGAIDPGLVLYLIRERGLSAEAVEDLISRRSGLLGVSGVSDDMRVLEVSKEPAAQEALDLFAYRCVRETGSLIAALGGLDALVFTAGIGEHSAPMRRKIAEGLAWMGLRVDRARNEANARRISADDSAVDVFVVPTDEELVIARAVRALLGPGS